MRPRPSIDHCPSSIVHRPSDPFMKLQHIVLTRFATRPALSGVGMFMRDIREALTEEALAERLWTFSAVTVPSLAAQTDANFSWLVMVDGLMPEPVKDQIRTLLVPLPHARVVRHDEVFGPKDDITQRRWLDPFIADDTTHVLTTNLDNDDGVGRTFVSTVQDRARSDMANPRASAVRLYGIPFAAQWNCEASPEAPLGLLKQWVWRDPFGQDYFISPGESCLAPRDADIHVLHHSHAVAAAAQHSRIQLQLRHAIGLVKGHFKPSPWFWQKHAILRKRLQQIDRENPNLPPGRWVVFLPLGQSDALMINHSSNFESDRKTSGLQISRPLRSAQDLGNVAVNWPILEKGRG